MTSRRALPLMAATLTLVTASAGCTGPGMRALRAPPVESTAAVPASCEPVDLKSSGHPKLDGVDCRQQGRSLQTWRAQAGLYDDAVKLVFVGDAGIRASLDGVEDPANVGTGPLAVSAAAEAACQGSCTGVVFLGDNLYQSGINRPDDSAFLRRFATAWSWAGPAWFVLGNHDWGAYPKLMPWAGKAPNRNRAQRLFRDLRALSTGDNLDLRGDSHFWATSIGQGRLVGLDTNYLVRRCRTTGEGIRCKGDPRQDKPDHIAIGSLVERVSSGSFGPVIVAGHHPWLSNGEHGEAGQFKDGGQSLWKGAAFRRLLDTTIAPGAALYVAGHDHNSQVGRIDDDTLAIVVGAGGQTTAAGDGTAPGEERHVEAIEHEVYCALGFAVVEVGAKRVQVEVHTLPHPDASNEDLRECFVELTERRGDLAIPDGPTCRRWTWDGSRWGMGSACEDPAP